MEDIDFTAWGILGHSTRGRAPRRKALTDGGAPSALELPFLGPWRAGAGHEGQGQKASKPNEGH